ncbi:CaiB/BaiF CoA-transferase family protein [Actinophytocola xinjiangensis]|uniref:CaiB/BaiF CoA-transferase family protein n=1 Tax=Actinophytocola xinjiangensis TaxID=485602 RepID=UPI0009FC5DD9|nr:CoA transferase [Actinophytocola xinjiangensis]
MTALLTGLTVGDLSTGLAGVYAARLCHELGATVHRPAGLPVRFSDAGTGGLPAARAALTGYLTEGSLPAGPGAVESADLVLDDGTLDVAALRARRPEVVVVTITDFGSTGPWTGRPATSAVLQAAAGSTAWRGEPSAPPVQAGGEIEQYLAGAYALAGALACLRGAARTGLGDHLDLSVLEATNLGLTTFGTTHASLWGHEGTDFPGRSVQIPAIERTRDGWVGLCTISARQRQDLMVLVGRPDLADDESLAYGTARQQRQDELKAAIVDWAASLTTAEVVDLASAFRIPVAPVGSGDTLLDNEQLRERGFFTTGADGLTRPGPPLRFTGDGTAPSRPDTGDRDGLPLAGLRVLDLTAWWAGPASTHLLAALGADVVKVESARRPDGMRLSFVADPTARQWWEYGPVYFALNTNKRGIALDLSTSEGAAVLGDLARRADVLIENFTPRVLDSFPLDWPAVRRDNPRLVTVRMPAFGLTGSWRDRTGFAQTIEQASGLAWTTGYPDGPPLAPRGVCDPLAGVHAALACLAALRHRDRTGVAGTVEVPMLELAVRASFGQLAAWQVAGIAPQRLGNRDPSHAPQGVYPSAEPDRWIALSVRDDREWAALAGLIGQPARTAGQRRHHHDEIDEAITRWTRRHPPAELVAALEAHGVPAAVVTGPGRLTGNPQLAHRRFFEPVDHPVAGTHVVPGLPFRSARHDVRWNRTAAPTLGQHTAEVLTEWLGLTDQDIATLAEVTADWPDAYDNGRSE